jgi:hypothetical protein
MIAKTARRDYRPAEFAGGRWGESMNYVLIIWTLTSSLNGQFSMNVTQVPIGTDALCRAAMQQVGQQSGPWGNPKEGAGWVRVLARCVQAS